MHQIFKRIKKCEAGNSILLDMMKRAGSIIEIGSKLILAHYVSAATPPTKLEYSAHYYSNNACDMNRAF
jgi:hypothetical protein